MMMMIEELKEEKPVLSCLQKTKEKNKAFYSYTFSSSCPSNKKTKTEWQEIRLKSYSFYIGGLLLLFVKK